MPSSLPPLRVSPSLPSLFHAANTGVDDDQHDEHPCVVDRDSAFPVSQPSTPDRLLCTRSFSTSSPHTTPTPPLTPSSASTTTNSNAWRSPTSPLTVANVRLAADAEHGLPGIGLGLGLPFGERLLDEDLPLRSLSVGDAEAFFNRECLRPSNDGSGGAQAQNEGRYLLVRGVPPTASNEEIHEVFTNVCARASPLSNVDRQELGDSGAPLRGICVRLLATHGTIVLAFHDPRHVASAERAIRTMQTAPSPGENGCDWRIEASRIGEAKLREMLIAHSPNSPFNFITETEGVLLVCIESTNATRRAALDDVASIRLLLEGFGKLRIFEALPQAYYADHDGIAQAYKVEYFDARKGAQAREKLDGRSLFGTRLRVQAFSAITSTSASKIGSGNSSNSNNSGSGSHAHACQPQQQLQIDSPRTATTGGAGESTLSSDSSGPHGLFARYAFPPLSSQPVATTTTGSTAVPAPTTIATRSQPASPLGMLSALAPLSTATQLQHHHHTHAFADPSRTSPSLPSSPLSSSASFSLSSKDREMLVALSKAALPSSSSSVQQASSPSGSSPSSISSSSSSQMSPQQQQSIRRISTGSLIMTTTTSNSNSGSNSSSGTVTANVSPTGSGRSLSPIRGKGSEAGGSDSAETNVAVHPSSSEQDLRKRASVSAALQAQAQASETSSTANDKGFVPSGMPSSPSSSTSAKLDTDLVTAQRSPLRHTFPLEEDDSSLSNSPLEQTTFPSIWQSPLSPDARRGRGSGGGGNEEDDVMYWDGEPYPPPGPFSFPEMEDALPTAPSQLPPPVSPPMYAAAPPPPFGVPPLAAEPGLGMHAGAHHPFMQVPMTPVQRPPAYAHSSAFGMLSPPQEDHRSLGWGADGLGGNNGSNNNGLSLSPPSSILSASSSATFTPPRFNRMGAGPGAAELLLSPLSPQNMYRGPTPFNTPAVPFGNGQPFAGHGVGGGGGARARQHPPPHAHPPRSSNLYTAMRSPSSPSSRSSPTSASGGASNEKNQIDLERIAAGLDTRTTVMIKNIPNKLSDKDLIEYIGKVCPRKIDFLYLRMDFQNGCNVGYAFVNFIRVEDLLLFARAKLGVKWNMFSSEKVLQMSYANYQGKEALVEKFKNSCVMDEREAWRPKIFYSSGSRQGLPEPFPSPTHLRRKERSSQNRGALFVPSPPSMYGGGSAQTTPRQEPMMQHQHPATLGGRYRNWVLPSHGSPSSSGEMGMMHGHESLAPAPSLS